MADATYQPLVYRKQAGNELHVASGGILDIETGGLVKANGTQASATTAALTTITHTAPSTPDYVVQDLTTSTPYGFASHDEGNTVLKVIANLQTQVAELKAALVGVGIIPS